MLYRSGQAVPAREVRPRNGDHGVDLPSSNEPRMALRQVVPPIVAARRTSEAMASRFER